MEIAQELAAIAREVGTRTLTDGEGLGIVLRRQYDAPIATVWDALTDPDTVRRS